MIEPRPLFPRRWLPALAFALALSAAMPGQASAPVAVVDPPRLLVLCSVDQLASWVLQRALPHMGEDGFRRLLRQGVEFTRCAHLHACSETGPGHATIGTGAPARGHGIVKNQWHDRDGKAVYCVAQDGIAALPELPEGKDRGPGRLRVPTFGDQLKAAVPGSKVVSVAWKDRSAILMAGARADAVAWIEVTTGRLVTNTLWCKAVPGWVAEFNQKQVLAGFHGWVWDRCAPPAAYADLIDDRPFETPHLNRSKTRTLPQVIDGGNPDAVKPGFYAQAWVSPVCNEVTLQAALLALAQEQLGVDAVPDLLCVSFSATDLVGHAFGPDSHEARDTLLRMDRVLARLFAALDAQVGAGRWLFVLTADHGVGPVPEAAKAMGVDAGRGPLQTRARAAAEKALVERYGRREGRRPFVQQAAEMSLYLDRAVLAEVAGDRPLPEVLAEACALAAKAAGDAPGISTAFSVPDLQQQGPGDDALRRACWQAIDPERGGDVMLVQKRYWLEGSTVASHGSPWPYDREVPLLAMGGGLRTGSQCIASVSPGLGVVLMARAVGLPPPPGAVEPVPDDVFAAPKPPAK